MSTIFNTILFEPIFNALVFIYNIIPGKDFGIAIVGLTILIRILFIPLSLKTLKAQRELARVQPKIKELQEKHKGDKNALGQATMALYKEHKVNPLGGCLPMLIQLPVLIALYKAFSSGLKPESLQWLYPFVANPGAIKELSLGFINLAQRSPVLAILAGVLQWFQARQSAKYQARYGAGKVDPTTQMMNRQMLYFFPIMIIVIAWNLPTGLAIYWIVTTLFSIIEQYFINRNQTV